MKEKKSIWIVEDDPMIRNSLKILINKSSHLICSQTFPSAEDYLQVLQKVQPDIVLMDITLPYMDGIEAARRSINFHKDLKIIMLTVHQDSEMVFKALCSGALGYLLKNAGYQKIIDAIDELQKGGAPMSSSIARMVVASFKKNKKHDLSARELEVLVLLSKGKSYKMIAEELFISHDTIRTHIKNIYRKLGVKNNINAVTKAMKNGII